MFGKVAWGCDQVAAWQISEAISYSGYFSPGGCHTPNRVKIRMNDFVRPTRLAVGMLNRLTQRSRNPPLGNRAWTLFSSNRLWQKSRQLYVREKCNLSGHLWPDSRVRCQEIGNRVLNEKGWITEQSMNFWNPKGRGSGGREPLTWIAWAEPNANVDGSFSESHQAHRQIPMRNQAMLGRIKQSELLARIHQATTRVPTNWDTLYLVYTRTK